MNEEHMMSMAKSVCNQNQPSPTQLVTELWRLFYHILVPGELVRCLKVSQGCKHSKHVLVKYTEPWKCHRMFFFFHKCDIQMSCSSYPTSVYKVFSTGVSWWLQCLRWCGLDVSHITTALRIWMFHFVCFHTFRLAFELREKKINLWDATGEEP